MRILTAFSALALLSLGGCATSGVRPQTNITEAMPLPPVMAADAESRGDWAGAARHWEAASIAAPAERAYALKAVRAMRLSHACGRAQTHLQRLQSATPDALDVLLEAGKCHLVSGRYDAAQATLTAALASDPNSWEAATVLATAYDLMERPETALTFHERAAMLAPKNPMVLSNKAMSLALAGDLNGALAVMRRAAAQSDASARVRMNLAFLEAIAGNGDVAAMMARQENAGDAEHVKLLQRIAAAARQTPSL